MRGSLVVRHTKQINEIDRLIEERLINNNGLFDEEYFRLLIVRKGLDIELNGSTTEKQSNIAETITLRGVYRSASKGDRSTGSSNMLASLIARDLRTGRRK